MGSEVQFGFSAPMSRGPVPCVDFAEIETKMKDPPS